MTIDHIVDPASIQTGQLAHFVCPEEDCSQHFWKVWLPDDALTRFGDPVCWMHGNARPKMRITEVRLGD